MTSPTTSSPTAFSPTTSHTKSNQVIEATCKVEIKASAPVHATPLKQPTKGTRVKDPEYYRESGDCLVLVGDSLFKIHSYLLTKESPVFQEKLVAVKGVKTSLGEADTDPILLEDDVEYFRDLCWVLYAGPGELWQLTDAPVKFPDLPLPRVKKLLRIAAISQKYAITSTRTWAVRGISNIYEMCDKTKNPGAHFAQVFAFEPTTTLLKHLTIAAELSQNATMFTKARETWISRIEDGQAIAHEALAMAQEKGWRQFQGRVYLAILRGLAKSNSQPAPFILFKTEPTTTVCRILDTRKDVPKANIPFGPNSAVALSLPSEHMTRLLKGHLVLTQLQREFAGVDGCHIPFGSASQFARKLEAIIWEDFWKACVRHVTRQQQTGIIHNDLLAMMTCMQELMDDIGKGKKSLDEFGKLPDYACLTSNIPAALTLLGGLKDKFRENLADYFFVP